MYHSLLSLKIISFVAFPQASQPSVNLNVSKLVFLHDRPHDTTVTVRRDKISLSLRSWGGFLCPGYFLGGGGATPHAKRAAKPRGKIPPAAFLMSFECRPFLSARLELFDYPVRRSGVIDTDRTRKRARPSVTIKSRTETTTCCKLLRTQAGYWAVIPNF